MALVVIGILRRSIDFSSELTDNAIFLNQVSITFNDTQIGFQLVPREAIVVWEITRSSKLEYLDCLYTFFLHEGKKKEE